MNEEEEEVLRRLDRYIQLNQIDDAIEFIDALIYSNSTCLEDAITMLASYLNLVINSFEKSLQLIQKGLAFFPSSIPLKLELCRNFQVRGYLKESLEMCQQLTKEYPSSVEVWQHLADLYCIYGDYEEAIEAIDFAIACCDIYEAIMKITYHLYLSKAELLIMNENYHQAINCLNTLIWSNKKANTNIRLLLADCYMHMGNYERAFICLSRLYDEIDIFYKIDYYAKFFICCLRTDRKGLAIEVLADAFEHNPRSLEYITWISTFKYAEKETELGDEKIINTNKFAQEYFINNSYSN